jgi:MFS superfamily sulfate permease-like transporter
MWSVRSGSDLGVMPGSFFLAGSSRARVLGEADFRCEQKRVRLQAVVGGWSRKLGVLAPDPLKIRQEWFSNVRGDLLAGIVVALALMPEAIAFSIIAGVDPKVGLYASFCIAVVTAFVGGRPGMISAATGAMALLMITLVKDHGLEYLFAATILTGVVQIVFGWLKLGRYMRFVPRSVMVGFVNALAILIFMAQLPQFIGATWLLYAFVAAGLAIIYLLLSTPVEKWTDATV